MKRVMILVLPTDWSPKNSSLYFAKADIGAIFFVPISDLSILLLFYYHFEIFRISGFKIGDLVSYRRTELSWVFISENSSVLFCAWNGYGLFSWLQIWWTMLSLFWTFLFGFYNFIWGTPLLAIVILFGFSWMRSLINAWIYWLFDLILLI